MITVTTRIIVSCKRLIALEQKNEIFLFVVTAAIGVIFNYLHFSKTILLL